MADFEHRVYSPWSQRIYWNDNRACGVEEATVCVLQVGPDAFYTNLEFAWPADRSKVEKVERMLEAAYGLGQVAAKKEIRDVLGVKEPRP